jgi:acetyl/propionyl-CoA carboxylase alpha subunit
MMVEIEWQGRRVHVQIPSTNEKKAIVVNGREMPCDCIRLPDGTYSLLIDGRVYDLGVELDGDRCIVVHGVNRHTLVIHDPRRLATGNPVEEGQPGLQRISADMPGKVIRVLVREGDTVAYDQGLLVLEAMKMQNEIRAPKRGVVIDVGVVEGKAVNSGDFLISVE